MVTTACRGLMWKGHPSEIKFSWAQPEPARSSSLASEEHRIIEADGLQSQRPTRIVSISCATAIRLRSRWRPTAQARLLQPLPVGVNGRGTCNGFAMSTNDRIRRALLR